MEGVDRRKVDRSVHGVVGSIHQDLFASKDEECRPQKRAFEGHDIVFRDVQDLVRPASTCTRLTNLAE